MPVRLAISILLDVAMLLAFVRAPSFHVHAHDATERHVAAWLHTHAAHVEARPSNQPEWRDVDPEDDAQFLYWLSLLTRSDGRCLPVSLTASNVILPRPIVEGWQPAILRPRAHDPPALAATAPRAPPV